MQNDDRARGRRLLVQLGVQRAAACYSDGSFESQMSRFLPTSVLRQTVDSGEYRRFIGEVVKKAYEDVARTLGISREVEACRRKLAADIASGTVSPSVIRQKRL